MVDYTFYLNKYFGNIIPNENEWNKVSRLAKNKVDLFTFGRASKVNPQPQEVNFCICEVADYIFSQKQMRNVVSENTDGHSVTFVKKTKEDIESDIRQIVLDNLANTNLMYPGVLTND